MLQKIYKLSFHDSLMKGKLSLKLMCSLFLVFSLLPMISSADLGESCGYRSDESPFCDSGLKCEYFQCVKNQNFCIGDYCAYDMYQDIGEYNPDWVPKDVQVGDKPSSTDPDFFDQPGIKEKYEAYKEGLLEDLGITEEEVNEYNEKKESGDCGWNPFCYLGKGLNTLVWVVVIFFLVLLALLFLPVIIALVRLVI
jgi:hypothetical protein